jgi:sugar/nucleoside kinase (ribokinase family)
MICIVGALSVDLLFTRERFHKGTSNPAPVRISPGGVGYRIYSQVDDPKLLFTALGSDVFGKWLIEQLDQPQGVHPLFFDKHKTACYCSLMQAGELLYGAADMEVVERGLTWPLLRARLPDLGKRDFLVLEANLSPDLVRSMISHLGRKTRVVFESVSVEKLLRHSEVLKNLFLLSGNVGEIRALGERVTGPTGNAAAQRSLRSESLRSESLRSESLGWIPTFLEQRNIEQLLVTRGSGGISLYRKGSGKEGKPLTLRPGHVLESTETTGAGDRLLSTFLAALDGGGGGADALDNEATVKEALLQAMASVEQSIEEGSL